MTEVERAVLGELVRGAPDLLAARPPVDGRRSLPTASLVVDERGAAVAVGDRWTSLTGQPSSTAIGDGWQLAIDPADRTGLLEQLRGHPTIGHGDCRVLTGDGRRWMRLWWQAGGEAVVEVQLVDIDDLWQRAALDPLTGLVNRRAFLDAVDGALRRERGSAVAPALVFIDLDGFKQVNDAHGHLVGDAVLADVAARIARAVRPSDLVGRIGGDEFAVLCDQPGRPAEATALAERIERSVADPSDGPAWQLSATTGVAQGSLTDTGETLIARADQAMYAARALRATQGLTGAPAKFEGSLPDDDEAVIDLATSVVHRIFGVGLTLHTASSVADQETKIHLQEAVDALDEVITDVRRVVFGALSATAATEPPARAIDLLLDAIDAAEHELHDEWADATDPLAPPGYGNRLAKAARHVRAAVRSLDPDTLG